MIVYRTAKHLPNSGLFCQAIASYVKTVIDVEWDEMEKGAMSPEAEKRFEAIWSRYYELGSDLTSSVDFTPVHEAESGSALPEAPCCKAICSRRSGYSYIWFYFSGLRSIFYQSRAHRGVPPL